MTRSDMHRDAMLRRLGVTYYESLYGKATAADVSRALDSVAGHRLGHSGERAAAAAPRPPVRMDTAAGSSTTGRTRQASRYVCGMASSPWQAIGVRRAA